MKLISASLIFFPVIMTVSAIAAPPKAQPDFRYGGGAADLLGKTRIDLGEGRKPFRKFQVTTDCTTSVGQRLKPEDAGYENCMRNAGQFMQATPTDANGDKANVGMKYKF